MNCYETLYSLLDELGVIDVIRCKKSSAKANGFMDLHFDMIVLSRDQAWFSLSHDYKENGDTCVDPYMEIRVYLSDKKAEALSYETSIPPVVERVYPEPDLENTKVKVRLNQFLTTWLANLKEQGHRFQSNIKAA